MPKFFGYELDVKSELERQGAIVDWLPDRPFELAALKALTKVAPDALLPFTDIYYEKLLKKFDSPKYNKILVINGQTLSFKFLNRLRTQNPSAELILYMWDSVKNRPNILKNIPLFNKVLSFDRKSAAAYGFRHRPLFFSPGFEPSSSVNAEFNLSFIGTAHSDRYGVISNLKKSLPASLRNFWYLYLQEEWVYYAYKLTNPHYKNASLDEFEFRPLEKSIVRSTFANSFSILDIEHPFQAGLTMRTLEAFGSHKKLVTTNGCIREYDLYDPDNVCVIDRENPRIPDSFFNNAFVPPSLDIYNKYSLQEWVNEIFN